MLSFMKQRSTSEIPWPVFAVTVAAAFMVALDLSIVNVAFPSIRRSFPDVSTASLSWVLAAYSVVFGALLLGAGRIADRSGRRRIFLLGLLVFTVGSLLCGIAPSAWLLIGGRVVQAIGAALLMPASLALLLTATPPAARAQAVAMWGGISALAVATGPSLGSLLIDAGGWRWAFFVNLPIALAAGLSARRLVPESIIGGPIPDLVGVAILSAAVASLALAITQGGEWGWSSARIVGLFLLAAVLAPLAIRRSARHKAPAIDLELFKSRTVVLANAATFLYAVGLLRHVAGERALPYDGVALLNAGGRHGHHARSTGRRGAERPEWTARRTRRLRTRTGRGRADVRGRVALLCVGGRGRAALRHALVARRLARRGRRRFVVPRPQRGRRRRTPPGTVRRGWCGESNRPPDRRGARSRHPHRDHRHAVVHRRRARPLPCGVGARRGSGARLGGDLLVPTATRSC